MNSKNINLFCKKKNSMVFRRKWKNKETNFIGNGICILTQRKSMALRLTMYHDLPQNNHTSYVDYGRT